MIPFACDLIMMYGPFLRVAQCLVAHHYLPLPREYFVSSALFPIRDKDSCIAVDHAG